MTKYELSDLNRAIRTLRRNDFDEHADDLQSLVDAYDTGERPLETEYYATELADDVSTLSKSCLYEYSINREEHGDYTLSISKYNPEESTDSEAAYDHIKDYEHYLDNDHAETDIALLQEAGINIMESWQITPDILNQFNPQK